MFVILYAMLTIFANSVQLQKTSTPNINDCPRFDYEYKLLERLLRVEFGQREMDASMVQLQEKVQTLESDVLKKTLEIEQLVRDKSNVLGSIYVRWGRTICPGNGTELLYKGFASGSHHSHTGGSADFLCLPEDPNWGKHVGGTDWSAHIYGAEYELVAGSNPFSTVSTNDDVPCCVCKTSQMDILIIPGKTNCYHGWTIEYTGYLMSGYYGHAGATNYVCVDENPEAMSQGSANMDGHLLYVVQARCGSLPCPPYVEGRAVACVVCSR